MEIGYFYQAHLFTFLAFGSQDFAYRTWRHPEVSTATYPIAGILVLLTL